VRFTVDPEGLAALHDQLVGIQADMQNIGSFTGNHDPLDLGTNDDVFNSLQNFYNQWSNGLSIVTDDMTAIVESLATAAEGYAKTENSIVTAETPKGS